MYTYMYWKRPWCWGRLKTGRKGDDRGWDGWMASPTQWTWIEHTLGDSRGQGRLACCSPRGRRVRYNWATEQQEQYMLLNFCFSPINPLSTGGRGGLSQEHRRVERKLLFLPYSGKVGRVWNVLLEEAKTRFCLKTEILGTSLALQWIRLCLPMQGV